MGLIWRVGCLAVMAMLAAGCTTRSYVKLPADSVVYLHERQVSWDSGRVVSRPFFWTAFSGVKYEVEKGSEVTQKGRLATSFRPVALFWPPFAIIYAPMGLKHDCYDFTLGAEPQACTRDVLTELRTKYRRDRGRPNGF